MHPMLADLLQVLRLESLGADRFQGESRDPGHRRVFGGQVLGQALRAAYATLEDRWAHSLHAYFLRAGDPDHPVVYEVDRSRDGTSFSSRRVVAIQHDEQIFHLSASFQTLEDALDRQAPMPDVPPPETLPDMSTVIEEMKAKAPDRPRPFVDRRRPFEFRPVRLPDPDRDDLREPKMQIWFRASDAVPDDQVLHQCLLAYASDYYLLSTAGLDVRYIVSLRELQMASIDHAMWFHRPARVDEWLLYILESPTATSSRGFARGTIFSRDGRLVASTAQEGLVRRSKRIADGG